MKLLDVDPVFGTVDRMSYDHATGSLTIERTQDIGAILENNAETQNGHFDRKSDMWPCASVPLNILEGWRQEFNAKTGRKLLDAFSEDQEWERFVYGRLDDSSFRKLRTGLFRIGR